MRTTAVAPPIFTLGAHKVSVMPRIGIAHPLARDNGLATWPRFFRLHSVLQHHFSAISHPHPLPGHEVSTGAPAL